MSNQDQKILEDGIEVVRLRNDFYRDNYRKLMIALLICVCNLLILLACVVYIVNHPPAPHYFAISPEGRLTPLVPLNQPNLSDTALRQWAAEAARAVYTYDFVHYKEAINKLRKYFTPDGWSKFKQALYDSSNLQAVTAKKMVVSAIATGTPIILTKGLLSNHQAWEVQIPMLITYQSASDATQQNVLVKIQIVRVSELESAYGIGISNFLVLGTGGIS